MNKKYTLLIAGLIFTLALSGCSKNNEEKTVHEDKPAVTESVETKPETKKIVDLTGAEVEIPVAENINRVVIIAPPLPATFASVVKDTIKIVGSHPRGLSNANPEILELIIPNWKDINTSFIDGFTSNVEELMNLKPDLILVYGDTQKEGLDKLGVPVVDFFQNDSRNEEWSVKIDELMRDIFEKDENDSLKEEWKKANEIVKEPLGKIGENKKKAIMINSNDGGIIAVRGGNYYGDDWLVKTGLINCASGTDGDGVQVSMEQIYEWNPDVIYDFGGTNADKYLNNQFDGQDWSKISAVKNKQVYNMPRGMFNWGAPNADSPLTLVWMTMNNYEGTIEENFFKDYMFDYYERQYNIKLNDELYKSILSN